MDGSNPVDFFDVRALLDDDERLIRDTVARFVDREVTPLMADCFAAERFPLELVPRLAELGLFGVTLRGYGCAGVSATAYGLICEELERGDSSVRSCVSVQSSLVMGCIFDFGSEEQRSRWLPELARGTIDQPMTEKPGTVIGPYKLLQPSWTREKPAGYAGWIVPPLNSGLPDVPGRKNNSIPAIAA